MIDGLFDPRCLAYFSFHAIGLLSVFSGVFASVMTEFAIPAPDGQRVLKSPKISFEFFPPKTKEMERSLWETINRLAPLAPNFVSVTYGAGGSTRERTHSTIARILAETSLVPAAHLTCVGAARGEIDEIVDRYHDIGVRHIVALRGDPIGGLGTPFIGHPDGYRSSADLVAGIKKRHGDIEVSVSAYPEKHPDAQSLDADIDTLKAKVDAGAARAITQVFFDNDLYLRYLDRVRARGDWEAWVDFFLEGLERTALGAVQTARRFVGLFEQDTRRVQALGRGAANTLRVLAALRGRPVLALRQVCQTGSVNFPTASKGMMNLVAAGIAREHTGQRR